MQPITIYPPHTKNTKSGFGLVEAIVVISVSSVAFAAVLGAAVFFLRGGLLSADKTQALYLLEEGIEAVRFLRDESYSGNITPLIGAGPRYLDPTADGWIITTTNTAIFGKYTRIIELTSVHRRNADDDIVPATSGDPKTVDPGTAHLTVTVSWGSSNESFTTYVTDLYDN